MKKITGLEIENPYRYRGYEVGNTPTYAIENSTFLLDDIDKKIEKIKFSLELLAYQVIFIDGSCTEISINQSGLIVHTDANEVEDDEGLD